MSKQTTAVSVCRRNGCKGMRSAFCLRNATLHGFVLFDRRTQMSLSVNDRPDFQCYALLHRIEKSESSMSLEATRTSSLRHNITSAKYRVSRNLLVNLNRPYFKIVSVVSTEHLAQGSHLLNLGLLNFVPHFIKRINRYNNFVQNVCTREENHAFGRITTMA